MSLDNLMEPLLYSVRFMEDSHQRIGRKEVTEPITKLVNAGLTEYKSQVDDYFYTIPHDISQVNEKQAFVFICLIPLTYVLYCISSFCSR